MNKPMRRKARPEISREFLANIQKKARDRRPSRTPLLFVCICLSILVGLLYTNTSKIDDSAPPVVIPHIPISALLDGDLHTEDVFFNKHECFGVTTDSPGNWYVCTDTSYINNGDGVETIKVDFLCKKINNVICRKLILTDEANQMDLDNLINRVRE